MACTAGRANRTITACTDGPGRVRLGRALTAQHALFVQVPELPIRVVLCLQGTVMGFVVDRPEFVAVVVRLRVQRFGASQLSGFLLDHPVEVAPFITEVMPGTMPCAPFDHIPESEVDVKPGAIHREQRGWGRCIHMAYRTGPDR